MATSLFERIGRVTFRLPTPDGFRGTRIVPKPQPVARLEAALGAGGLLADHCVVLRPPNSTILAFGIEGITGADSRAAVIGRASDHLLD